MDCDLADMQQVLERLPPALPPQQLTALSLHSNQLTTLDRSAASLFTHLTHLDISSNLLSDIAGIGQALPWLQTLNLANNKVQQQDPRRSPFT